MVLVKALGMMDIVAGVLLLLVSFHVVSSWKMGAIVACVLIAKGLLFIRNVVSVIDVIIGVYFFVALFHPFVVLSVVCSAHLCIKGLFSLLS
jgi:uncharacterized membrane protein HdeD (DUF308 family)